MKGNIDIRGNLHIERAGILRPQFCSYKDIPCGDHCPKFGEPREDYITTRNAISITGLVLPLCTRDQLFFTVLIDNRK